MLRTCVDPRQDAELIPWLERITGTFRSTRPTPRTSCSSMTRWRASLSFGFEKDRHPDPRDFGEGDEYFVLEELHREPEWRSARANTPVCPQHLKRKGPNFSEPFALPRAGLEPARLSAPPPQDGVSTNSTTWAFRDSL
jgi:hypothetical protein